MLAFGRARQGSMLLLSICVAWLCRASADGNSLLSWLSAIVPDNHDGATISFHDFQEWESPEADLPTVLEEPKHTEHRALKRQKKFKNLDAPSFNAPSASFKAPSTKKAKKAPFNAPASKSAKSVKAPFNAPAGKGGDVSKGGKRQRRH